MYVKESLVSSHNLAFIRVINSIKQEIILIHTISKKGKISDVITGLVKLQITDFFHFS